MQTLFFITVHESSEGHGFSILFYLHDHINGTDPTQQSVVTPYVILNNLQGMAKSFSLLKCGEHEFF